MAKKEAQLWVPEVGWQQTLRRAENKPLGTGTKPGPSERTGHFLLENGSLGGSFSLGKEDAG